MPVLVKSDFIAHRPRQARLHGSRGIARWRHSSEWVSERGLRSRDFEFIVDVASVRDVGATSKRISQASPETPPLRTGRGSLRGQLIMADDWDSDEVNSAIARMFGLES